MFALMYVVSYTERIRCLAGIVLNNQMDDFSTPNRTNVYGLHPSPANYIRPGKRPLSSMSPIIVEQAGQLRLVVGGSGGPRIISAVLQTVVRCDGRFQCLCLATEWMGAQMITCENVH